MTMVLSCIFLNNKNIGWEGNTRGRGYGDICIHIANSLCYTAESNTSL